MARKKAASPKPPPFKMKDLLIRGLTGIVILGGLVLFPSLVDDLGQGIISPSTINTHGGITKGDAELATLFTPEVLYWREDIKRWALERNINPNLIATIIQIESCGDPYASSGVGAQGLFQVMPYPHFENGENQLDPEINARRGLNHLQDCLQWSDYDVGLAFGCYNGGPSVLSIPLDEWYQESQNYYYWGKGIFGDASQGKAQSSTLQEWLNAGGAGLCRSASDNQQFFHP